jgi:hypothetical protein
LDISQSGFDVVFNHANSFIKRSSTSTYEGPLS